MPVDYAWEDSDQRAILLKLIERWTWEEVWEAYPHLKAMIDSVEGRVHIVIVCMDHLAYMTMPPGSYTQVVRVIRSAHPRFGNLYVVREVNVVVRMAIRAWEALAPDLVPRVFFLNSLEAVRAHIRAEV